MPDGSATRLKCPQCDADVVVAENLSGQLVTCDFCLEEFKAPPAPAKPAANPGAHASTKPESSPEGSAQEKPAVVDPLPGSPVDNVSNASDDEFRFADELPHEPGPGSAGWGQVPASDSPADSADEAWLRVDEDLTGSDEEDHPAKKVVLTSDYEFSGPCPLCATRFVATDAQIGTTIRCPDCHTEFQIPEPLPSARQPLRRGGSTWDDDDELRLSEPDDLATIRAPTDDPLGSLDDLDALDTDTALPLGNAIRPVPSAASWPRDDEGLGDQSVLADAAIQKAEAEIDAEIEQEVTLPPSPLTNGLFKCFADPGLTVRVLLFAIGLQIQLSALNGAIERAMIDDAMAHFTSLMLGCFSFLFGLGLFLSGAVSLLAVTQDTATGKDRIEGWPDVNFMDWVFEAFYVVCALFACLLVGSLAGQIFLPFGMIVYAWGLVFTVGLSTVIIFPVFLLGALETGLCVNPFSVPVMRSLVLARGNWIQFGLISLGLAFAGLFGWLLRMVESGILNFISALIVCSVLFLYFRLLGRLAWICQEAVADDDLKREEAS